MKMSSRRRSWDSPKSSRISHDTTSSFVARASTLRSGSVGLAHLRRLSRLQHEARRGSTRRGRTGAVLHHAAGLGVGRSPPHRAGAHHHQGRGDPAVRRVVAAPARHRRDVRRPSVARSCSDTADARRRAGAARSGADRSRPRALSGEPGTGSRAPSRTHSSPPRAWSSRGSPGLRVVVGEARGFARSRAVSLSGGGLRVFRAVSRRRRRTLQERDDHARGRGRGMSARRRIPHERRGRTPLRGGSSPIPRIGLVNVVAGRALAPEFVQHALEPRAVADALVPLLDPTSAIRAATLHGFDDVRAQLGEPGAATRVAALAVALAEGRAQSRRRVPAAERDERRGSRPIVPAAALDWRTRGKVIGATALLRSLRDDVASAAHRARSRRDSRLGDRRPRVYAFWHSQMLPALASHRNCGIAVLISEHRDGELIARVAARFGVHAIRGSTSRGAAGALRAMERALAEGVSVAVTPDGPRGPAEVFAPGTLIAAQRASVPIVLGAAVRDRAWRLRVVGSVHHSEAVRRDRRSVLRRNPRRRTHGSRGRGVPPPSFSGDSGPQ